MAFNYSGEQNHALLIFNSPLLFALEKKMDTGSSGEFKSTRKPHNQLEIRTIIQFRDI